MKRPLIALAGVAAAAALAVGGVAVTAPANAGGPTDQPTANKTITGW